MCFMTKSGGFHQKNCQINASKLAVFFMKNGSFERKKPVFFRQKCQFSFAGFTAFVLTDWHSTACKNASFLRYIAPRVTLVDNSSATETCKC